jgi:UDP-N-acetylglucosamine--N-acetylmuramyl-(pentapeptide) pyrophosphoryl-undecaprenol N-acetylglucosamine transferase
MKILLTGGGSGGHFYPIIAVAQSINALAQERKYFDIKLYYMAPQPYDERLLFENNITFIATSAGKIRRYFSIMNFFDLFRTAWGTANAIWRMYWIYPDIVFAKGGYVSFPAVFAAWFLRIPVVIHESDSVPGRVNKWAGKFAKRIAVSYPDAAQFFKKENVAFTGNPVREEIKIPERDGSHEFLGIDKSVPTVLFLGGSQGAQNINQTLLDTLAKLVEKYNVVHQTGKKNFIAVKQTADAVLLTNPFKKRYLAKDHMDSLTMRMAAGAADLIVSRAGSTIFEIAIWAKPSIIIPIPEAVSHDQIKNAYSYARTGAAVVLEENNLTPNLLRAEIERLMENQADREKMIAAAKNFARTDAALLIAGEIFSIAIEHEK